MDDDGKADGHDVPVDAAAMRKTQTWVHTAGVSHLRKNGVKVSSLQCLSHCERGLARAFGDRAGKSGPCLHRMAQQSPSVG